MNLRILWAFIKKELVQTLRDPRMRTLLFIAPVMQMTIFGLALRTEVRNIKLAVVAAPSDQLAWDLAHRAVGTGWFQQVELHGRDPYEAVRAGLVDAVMIAPPGGLTRAAGRGPAQVQLLVDGSNSVRAQGVYQYFDQVRQAVQVETLMPPGVSPPHLALHSRVLYNPTLESKTFMVPGVLAMLLVLVSLTLVSSSITREKERGTFETLLAAPIGRAEILLGKSVPYVLLAFLAQMPLVLMVSYFGFHVPIRGPLWELAVAAFAFILSNVCLGVVVSTYAQNQQQAMLGTFLILYPAQMLSGVLYPLDNMPVTLRWITYFNPLRYFTILIRNIMLKGGSLELFWPNVGALFLLSFFLLALAWRKFSPTLN